MSPLFFKPPSTPFSSTLTHRSLAILFWLGIGASGATVWADPVPTAPPPKAEAARPIPVSHEPWQPYKVKRGVSVDRRAVPGSRYFEYRVVVTAPLPPATILQELWGHVVEPAAPMVKKRTVIKQTATEIVMYDQIKTPVVSDRDYTLILHKNVAADGSRYEMNFETANHLGPPTAPGYVRITAIRGSWTAEPDAAGSRLTYTSFNEPGGSIPAFMIHGAQFDQVVDGVIRLQERLSKLSK